MTTERDIQNQIDFAMDKGRAEGRAEGHAEGRAEGRAEERAKIIKALKEQGVSEEIIAKALADTKE